MVLQFCPKCDSIMIPEPTGKGGFLLKCHHCGFSKKTTGKALVEKEKMPKRGKTGTKIAKEENTFAVYKNKCKKCGYMKAEVIDLGPSYSDEDNLLLLKCGKCGWSERTTKKSG